MVVKYPFQSFVCDDTFLQYFICDFSQELQIQVASGPENNEKINRGLMNCFGNPVREHPLLFTMSKEEVARREFKKVEFMILYGRIHLYIEDVLWGSIMFVYLIGCNQFCVKQHNSLKKKICAQMSFFSQYENINFTMDFNTRWQVTNTQSK